MKNNIIAIAAIDQNGGIGEDENLLAFIPGDLPRFKKITMNNVVIMGRKTWDTLPFKPLKGRVNIVLTRDKDFKIESEKENTSAYVCNSVEEVLELLDMEDMMLNPEGEERKVFCMGGGEIYKLLLPHTKTLMLTHIHKQFPDANIFFPELDKSEWREVSREDHCEKIECDFGYSYVNYEHKPKPVAKFLLEGSYSFVEAECGMANIRGVMTLFDDETFSGTILDSLNDDIDFEVNGIIRKVDGQKEIAFLTFPPNKIHAVFAYRLRSDSECTFSEYSGNWCSIGAMPDLNTNPNEIWQLKTTDCPLNDAAIMKLSPIKGGGTGTGY